MSTTKIENFFTGKTLQIPGYQREYAWKERNVNDLFGDVEEALEVGGGHYLGTFILSQKDPGAPVQVVDGQQRLSAVKELSAQFAGNTQRFQRQSLDARSKLLAGIVSKHWPIVVPVPIPVPAVTPPTATLAS